MDSLTKALITASRAVGAQQDPQEVLDALLDCVHSLVPTTSATVLLLSDGDVRVCAHRGWAAFGDPTGLSFPVEAPHLRRVVQLGQSTVLPDTRQAPGWRFVQGSDHTLSWLGVPLVADGEVLGVYSLDRAEAGGFEPLEIEQVEALAAHAAVVLKTARLIEALERARRDAERANRAKSAFLAHTSHELRTPLSALMGYAEMVEEGAVEVGVTTLADDARQVCGATRHLLSLVDTILDLSQVEAGALTIARGPVDLAALAAQVGASVEPLVRQGGNALRITGLSSLPTITDEGRVRQILVNLLGNAAKFTTDGHIELAVQAVRGVPTLQVRDTGIGMTSQELERIFEPFRQANEGISGRFGGTGLGLSLSRELAWLLGGDLTASSVVGKGTCFSLMLPVERAPVSATPPPP